MNTVLGIAAVVLLISANAFFVAVEFALVVVDRGRVNIDAGAGKRPWPTVQKLINNLSFNLSGAQFGITVTSLLIGYIGEELASVLLAPLLRPVIGSAADGTLSIVLMFMLATSAQLVFGELVPKNIAIADPPRILRRYAGAAALYGTVAGPLIKALNGTAEWLGRKVGIEPREELHAITTIEQLEHVIRSSGKEGTLDPLDVTLLTRTIRFGDKTAADALVPRVELDCIGIEKSVADLVTASVTTGHSRFPVIGNDLDDVRGIANVKAVHRIPLAERQTTPVSALMADPFVVPETRDLESILREMRASRSQVAVVVDEHGGNSGIVTVEDIVEEIVGEIEDEHDPEPDQLLIVEERGSLMLAGSMHPDEVGEACGFRVPTGDYETLAGFALDQLQRIPSQGELFEWDGWVLEVAEMDRWRIAAVRLTDYRSMIGEVPR